MDDDIQVTSAVDAVRCLYLAREAQRRGEHEAARRWREQAAPWLARLDGAWRPPDRQDDETTKGFLAEGHYHRSLG